MPKVLTTLYQGGDGSSTDTFEAAAKLAADLGSKHNSWKITPLVRMYTDLVNSLDPDNPLSWEKDDLTLQNIQARSRGPGIWMIANREGKLLIFTGNMSEAAVGYCTMDGDTVGGFGPIAGIGKSRILKINKYLAEEGVQIGPDFKFTMPNMAYINALEPSAELRPGGNQTDERDLMPYVVLDEIRRLHQLELLSPAEVIEELVKSETFGQLGREQITAYVKRYFMLNTRTQWKREREALGFHIEPDDCGPRSYRRFPVLNDGMHCLLAKI